MRYPQQDNKKTLKALHCRVLELFWVRTAPGTVVDQTEVKLLLFSLLILRNNQIEIIKLGGLQKSKAHFCLKVNLYQRLCTPPDIWDEGIKCFTKLHPLLYLPCPFPI